MHGADEWAFLFVSSVLWQAGTSANQVTHVLLERAIESSMHSNFA